MNCPACDHNASTTLETRDHGGWVKRRRECRKCGTRYITRETPAAIAWLPPGMKIKEGAA